jgi:hypothetical protein
MLTHRYNILSVSTRKDLSEGGCMMHSLRRKQFLDRKIFHGIVNYQPQITYSEGKTNHWVGGTMTRDLVVVVLGEIELQ